MVNDNEIGPMLTVRDNSPASPYPLIVIRL